MQYTPTIQEGDIADVYVAGMKLFSIKLKKFDCTFNTAEIRTQVSPGVFEISVPADFAPKITIQIEGTVQPDLEITF